MDGAKGRPFGRQRPRLRGWRHGANYRLDGARSSAGVSEGGWLVDAFDALERRGAPRWIVAGVMFLGGVAAVLPLLLVDDKTVDLGAVGWMAWGVVGAAAFCGFWLAALPYRGRQAARVLRWVGVACGLLPIALHVAGVL